MLARTKLVLALAAAFGIALTTGIAHLLHQSDIELAQSEARQDIEAQKQEIAKRFESIRFHLNAVESLYLASEEVTEEEFEFFHTTMLSHVDDDHPIRSAAREFGWVRWDDNAKGRSFVRKADREIRSTELSSMARRKLAKLINAQPLKRHYMLSGAPLQHRVTQPLRSSLTLLEPVFLGASDASGSEDGTENITGFVFAVIDAETLARGIGPQSSSIGAMELARLPDDTQIPAAVLAVSQVAANADDLAYFDTEFVRGSVSAARAFEAALEAQIAGAKPAYGTKDFAVLLAGAVITLMMMAYLFALDRQNRVYRAAKVAADDANELKSRFLANMSHEIRTPMNGILGMAKLIGRSELNQRQALFLRNLIGSAESLLVIINNILDFTKAESEEFTLDPQPTNVAEMARQIKLQFSEMAREKGIEVLVDHTNEVTRPVCVDETRLRQILNNLIGNAIKFTEKGQVALRIHTSPVAGDTENIRLVFTVTDTGIGMSEAALARIFDRFTQADVSVTKKFGGTGLGLAICRQLVTLMSGEIAVDSIPGQGTEFWFWIPVGLAKASSVETSDPSKASVARVLLVVDSQRVGALTGPFAGSGLRFDVCCGAFQALTQLRQAKADGDPYQIAVVDCFLADLNSLQFGGLVRETPEISDTQLVILVPADRPAMRSADSQFYQAHLPFPGSPQEVIDVTAPLLADAGLAVTRIWKALHGTRILLVEDDSINQLYAEEILSELGCAVGLAENGDEALRMLQAEPYDLILMDCQMPVLDGFEASRRIAEMKAEGALPDIPIIALTANAMKGDREKCLEAGMNDYLTKPLEEERLEQMIMQWMERSDMPDTEKQQAATHRPAATDAGEATGSIAANGPDGGPVPDAGLIPSAVGSASSDLIDQAILESTRAKMKAKFSRLLSVYLESTEKYIGDIEQHIAKGNLDEVTRPAHTIKSSSKLVGAMALSNVAAELELSAKAADTGSDTREGMSQQFAKLRALFRDSRECLQKCAEASS